MDWSGRSPSREKFVGLGGVWVGVSFFIVRGSWGPRAPQWSVLFRVGVSLALGRGDCPSPSPSPSAEERASGASGKGREWEGASARIWRGRRAASRCRWGCRITGLPVGRCVCMLNFRWVLYCTPFTGPGAYDEPGGDRGPRYSMGTRPRSVSASAGETPGIPPCGEE